MNLSEKQHQALTEIAQSTHRTIDEIIVEAIDSYLLKHEGDSFYESFDMATDFQEIGLHISHDETIAWAKNIEVEGIDVPPSSAVVDPFVEQPIKRKKPQASSNDYIGDSYLSLEGVKLPEYEQSKKP